MTDPAELATARNRLSKWSDDFAPAGLLQARLVRLVLAALDDKDALIIALSERCAGQSELLGKKAERNKGE